MRIHLILCCLVSLTFTVVEAQSPRNLMADIVWTSRMANVSAIQTAFNAARRGEETQLGLTPNVLGNLTLPADFLSRSTEIQALMLLNAERACRGGVNYGDGACKGWIFEGIESRIDNVAKTYANLMISSNCWGHNCGGTGTFSRISNALGANCIEFVSRGENLAVYATTGSTNPMPIVQSMYDWIYQDAGSAWGHREACFLQDKSLDGNVQNGFTDNHGAAGAEGFIGIGVAGSNTYSAPFGVAYNRADVVVLDFFDPVSTACSYSVLAIDLLSFEAKQKNGTTILTWQTASEKDNAGFTIERSTDGYIFESIGFVKGANNATSLRNYDFTDAAPLSNSVNYYRLTWESTGGKTENSKIIAVQLAEDAPIVLAYPNPMRDVLTIKSPNKNAHSLVQLINLQGQIVATANDNAQLNVAHLKAGVYFLQGVFNEKVVVQKLIKL